MRHPALTRILILAASSACLAEETTRLPTEGASTENASSVSSHARNVSTATAERVSAGLPKFAPKPTDDAAVANEAPDLRETDKPRNGIIRLPKYEVRDTKLPKFTNNEMLTPKGRVDLALKRHPGLKFGPLAFLNIGVGLQMLAEEEAYQRRVQMAELNDFVTFVETEFPLDPATGKRTAPANSK